jgi:type IV secretion system protein VirB11
MTEKVYLSSYLAPLAPWLQRPDVTDILVNRPGEVWIETNNGGMERLDVPALTEVVLTRLARQVAGHANQGVNREQPLLSASLPDGSRIQIISAPATRGGLALAIRKHTLSDLSVSDLASKGLFGRPGAPRLQRPADEDLKRSLDCGDYAGLIVEAVKRKKTIVLSGGTSSGKTTLLNALIKEIDASERLIVIEDAPEIHLAHANVVGLLAVRGELGEAKVTAEDLLQASLRMRPDRILLGELRGAEAFTFLRAVNTGHPGSITTVHADSPEGAIDQIAMLSLLGGVDLGWSSVRSYVRQVVDVIVQLRRENGVRAVSDVLLLPSNEGS